MEVNLKLSNLYNLDKIWDWINHSAHVRPVNLNLKELLKYIKLNDGFGQIDPTDFNLKRLLKKENFNFLTPTLKKPIIISNFYEIIDGQNRLLRAIHQEELVIEAIFIDKTILEQFKLTKGNVRQTHFIQSSQSSISDIYVKVPKERLPFEFKDRRAFVEDYFSEHLPTTSEFDEHWLIRLESPKSECGSYVYDPNILNGLEWWGEELQISDIPNGKKLLNKGILSIEDQWMPLSWSYCFNRLENIPKEVIIIHIDDHRDMMSPRVGRRMDGELFDYITGNHISFLKPNTVKAAIASGAIGKGSIITPLIWALEKVHVRHLSFRTYSNQFYKINNILCHDNFLCEQKNRISVHLESFISGELCNQSNYCVFPDIEDLLCSLPDKIPILLHVDMDYFNNRYDGNSNWKFENERKHEKSLDEQLLLIEKIMDSLSKNKLVDRIIDVGIGISAGFYPAEFWSITIPFLFEKANEVGLDIREVNGSFVPKGFFLEQKKIKSVDFLNV